MITMILVVQAAGFLPQFFQHSSGEAAWPMSPNHITIPSLLSYFYLCLNYISVSQSQAFLLNPKIKNT